MNRQARHGQLGGLLGGLRPGRLSRQHGIYRFLVAGGVGEGREIHL